MQQRTLLPRRVGEPLVGARGSAVRLARGNAAEFAGKRGGPAGPAPGCCARLLATRAQVALGIIRLTKGRVALVSKRSSGAASSSGRVVWVAMVIMCFRLSEQ